MAFRNISEAAAVDYGSTDRLLVLFSSKPAMRVDQYDYKDFFQDIPHTKLYLRDKQSDYFYHTGIAGLSSSIEETVDFLKVFIKRMKPSRTTFMGTSSGGYAAMLHAHLVGADPATRVDDVHVQSAITFIDPQMRERVIGNERTRVVFQNLADYLASQNIEHRYSDLAPIIKANPDSVRVMRMYHASGNRIDYLQVQNLAGLKNVQIVAHPSTSHIMLGMVMIREGIMSRDISMSVEDLLSELPTEQPAALIETADQVEAERRMV